MIPGLEETLQAHAKQHNLTHIDVGVMEVGGADVFTATVWWKQIYHETACAIGYGDSIVAAVGQALDRADLDRAYAEEAKRRAGAQPVETVISSVEGEAA